MNAAGTPKSAPQQASKPAETHYNAGDEAQVAERTQNVKARAAGVAQGLRTVMATKPGRAWMRHLLTDKLFTRVGRSRPAGIFTGNSTTFYNAALKELGDIVASELATLCPDEFRLMETEGEG